MSIEEAAKPIVRADALTEGGEVILLEMEDPILIADLPEDMVRLAGRSVRLDENLEGDIGIIEVGKSPGQKLHEDFSIMMVQRSPPATRSSCAGWQTSRSITRSLKAWPD